MVSAVVAIRSCGLRRRTQDHKWLVHTGRQHSFGSEQAAGAHGLSAFILEKG